MSTIHANQDQLPDTNNAQHILDHHKEQQNPSEFCHDPPQKQDQKQSSSIQQSSSSHSNPNQVSEDTKNHNHHSEKQGSTNQEQENAHELKSSVSHVPHHIRLTGISEIYNVPMSPTSISIAFDTHLKRKVIMKKIFKRQLDALQKKQAILECKVSCQLDHFNLIKGYDCYESPEEYILLMELANDAEYFQEKVENCHTPIKNELKLKSYITDVLNGLSYIHEQGYIHCDLKLANLFCVRSEEDGEDSEIRRVKVGDFGLMQRIDSATGEAFIEETCGTFGFKAPELKKGAYITTKADIWSLGVIMYCLTVAYMPHHMKGYKYGQGEVPFREFDWKKRSPELRDFVTQMLQLNPRNRISASEALQHPFLKMYNAKKYFISLCVQYVQDYLGGGR